MANTQKYLVTAALPYANGPLHLGHIAGAYLPPDIFVRYLRMVGENVWFVGGSDEHGAAITIKAKKEGKTPQQIVDLYHEINQKAFEDFGISFDVYDRTSDELHHQTAQEFFLKLHEKGAFDVETSEQFFDAEHNQFLADRYVTGTCPKCSNPNAYGDQCEKCGSALSPLELINPKSTLSGKTPILKETQHWYLPMGKEENWLRQWLEEGLLDGKTHHNPKTWKHQVLGQCKSWIDGKLGSRAMTRDLDWGVKVPLENAVGKVLYVWLDAPIGYISATKKLASQKGFDWKDFWQNPDSQLIHFIGKDNIVFHCIIFPILLKLHGQYNLPVNVPANEFLNLEGDKFSTSRNWAVWLHEYLNDFPGKTDELRYVLTAIIPEYKDSEFTWKDFQARVNNELVAILGNFVNRAVVLTEKYYNGKLPSLKQPDNELAQKVTQTYRDIDQHIRSFEFRNALQDAMNLARAGNKYLADNEPWKLVKTNPEKTAQIMANALHLLGHLAIVFRPLLPEFSKNLTQILGFEPQFNPNQPFAILPENTVITNVGLLFEKIEDETIEIQINKLKENTKNQQVDKAPNFEPVRPLVSFDDFTKLDIRTGKILTAEKVKGADKLLQLQVDTGIDTRTIVSGIAEHYKPEEVIGKTVTVLMNLAPRKIRGVESNGMILMAENSEGKLSFVSPENPELFLESTVR